MSPASATSNPFSPTPISLGTSYTNPDKHRDNFPWILHHIIECKVPSELPCTVMFSFNAGLKLPSVEQAHQWWAYEGEGKKIIDFLGSVKRITSSPDNKRRDGLRATLEISSPPTNHPDDRFMDAGNDLLLALGPTHSKPLQRPRSGIPVDVVESMCGMVFPDAYEATQDHMALHAIDYFQDLERTRRKALHDAAVRLDITKENWRQVLGNDPLALEWVELVQRQELELETLFTRCFIDMRIWTMVFELRDKGPFNKPQKLAMLNTLFPPSKQDIYIDTINHDSLFKYRKLFFEWIVGIEQNGPACMNSFVDQMLVPDAPHSWAGTHENIKMYFELAKLMLAQALAITDIEMFRRPEDAELVPSLIRNQMLFGTSQDVEQEITRVTMESEPEHNSHLPCLLGKSKGSWESRDRNTGFSTVKPGEGSRLRANSMKRKRPLRTEAETQAILARLPPQARRGSDHESTKSHSLTSRRASVDRPSTSSSNSRSNHAAKGSADIVRSRSHTPTTPVTPHFPSFSTMGFSDISGPRVQPQLLSLDERNEVRVPPPGDLIEPPTLPWLSREVSTREFDNTGRSSGSIELSSGRGSPNDTVKVEKVRAVRKSKSMGKLATRLRSFSSFGNLKEREKSSGLRSQKSTPDLSDNDVHSNIAELLATSRAELAKLIAQRPSPNAHGTAAVENEISTLEHKIQYMTEVILKPTSPTEADNTPLPHGAAFVLNPPPKPRQANKLRKVKSMGTVKQTASLVSVADSLSGDADVSTGDKRPKLTKKLSWPKLRRAGSSTQIITGDDSIHEPMPPLPPGLFPNKFASKSTIELPPNRRPASKSTSNVPRPKRILIYECPMGPPLVPPRSRNREKEDERFVRKDVPLHTYSPPDAPPHTAPLPYTGRMPSMEQRRQGSSSTYPPPPPTSPPPPPPMMVKEEEEEVEDEETKMAFPLDNVMKALEEQGMLEEEEGIEFLRQVLIARAKAERKGTLPPPCYSTDSDVSGGASLAGTPGLRFSSESEVSGRQSGEKSSVDMGKRSLDSVASAKVSSRGLGIRGVSFEMGAEDVEDILAV